ncbi:centlein [Carcharodon carcharias]|uniref:centlein n=1 Tax=Carcharodon carcharias TaxID=13397 RepID=UPI001B7E5A09|nr:centlein [Carcharodon carcharias]
MASTQCDPQLLLEEQVRKLSEELAQCQADKEFVWSLWKRLQVANPDLTQAISLVLEREKQKAEAKDRRVLEILQVKDDKIHELEQQVRCQQKEINNLIQRKIAVNDNIISVQKEVTDLKEKLKNKNQDYKDAKECALKVEEKTSLLLKNLEEEKQGLSTRCSDLLNDLEKQAAQWKEEKSDIDSKVKMLEDELKETRNQVQNMHNKCNELSSHLVHQQSELTRKDVEVTEFRKELQDRQCLYKESIEHAAQQAEVIQQLQALNLDTQKVLRNQEDAHASETKTYQKHYSELSMRYDALKSSEAGHHQRNLSLTTQLYEKEQQINQLLGKLQQALDSKQTATHKTTANCLEQQMHHDSSSDLEYLVTTQRAEIKLLKENLKETSGKLMERVADDKLLELKFAAREQKRQKDPSVKRSRSLSPRSCTGQTDELMTLNKTQQKIKSLEKLLKLKDQENEELRRAHDQRLERLQALQNNYRMLKGQLKELEGGQIKNKSSKNKMQRAEPWQLRQEDSDGVWNELVYFKREHKKLLTENMNLEEELDQLRVQAAMDKATIQELTICLQCEREELLFRLDRDEGVKYSTPKTKTKEKLEQSLKKISHLEKKLKTIQREAKDLKETNKELTQAKASLKTAYSNLQTKFDNQVIEIGELMKANQQIMGEKNELAAMIEELKTEAASLQRQMTDRIKLRNENEELLQKIHELQEALESKTVVTKTRTAGDGNCACKTVGYNPRAKRRKNNSLKRYQRFLNRSIKEMSRVFEHFNKDGWEDITGASDSEETAAESLGELIVKTAQQRIPPATRSTACSEEKRKQRNRWLRTMKTETKVVVPQFQSKVRKQKTRTLALPKQSLSIIALQQRLISLQQQIAVTQNGKKVALNAVNELKQNNQKLTAQLTLVNQKLQINKQTIQKLTFDLTEQQHLKDALDKKLNQMAEQQAPVTRSADESSSSASSRAFTNSVTPHKPMETELKQLQSKLKNATNEISKHLTTIKILKADHQEKNEQIRQLQERIGRMERDISMKRQLVEDLKSKLKANQENDKMYKGLLEDMEKKVRILTEEGSTRKALTESLKQRLNVATKEKSVYEEMHRKTTGELDRKNQKLHDLKTKVVEAESAMTELETTASQQMHGLAMQSEQALGVIQKKLNLANGRVEEFITFIKALAREICRGIQSRRIQLKRTNVKEISHEGLSKESINRAQSMAASILNISQSDLQDILDLEDEVETEERNKALQKDQIWLTEIQRILEGQLPCASRLVEAVLEKIAEKEKLAEEYALLSKEVS